MTTLRVLLSRMLDLLLRRRRDDRLSQEIQTHLDLLTEEFAARGLSAQDARQAARRAFGGVSGMEGAYRDQRGLPALDSLVQDVRFALRLLAKDRRFTIAIVIALVLGIGVNNSVFTLINTALLRDLPFEQPDRLVWIRTLDAKSAEGGVSHPDFEDTRSSVTSLSGMSAYSDGTARLAEAEAAPERIRATSVSASMFTVLGRSPALGRDFGPEDERAGAPPVVILADGLWRRRYGADTAVIGRTVRVNDVASIVIGVMPPSFRFPLITELWQPLPVSAGAAPARDGRSLRVLGRLADGVDLARARAELDAIAARLAQEHPTTNTAVRFWVRPLRESVGGYSSRPILMALMGAVGLVLLIACANVASLLLARSATRAREIAIRAALGATRARIVRQLLIECALLATAAGVIGVALSGYGARILATGFDVIDPGTPMTTPYWVDLTMDGFAYMFVGLACLFATLAFGLGPAVHVSKTDVNRVLKEGGRSGTGSARVRRWTGALVIAEIALTLVLLTGAGLFWRTFLRLYHADLVIDTATVVTMRLTLPAERYGTADQRRGFLGQLDERLTLLSTVPVATLSNAAPVGNPGAVRQLTIAGRPDLPGDTLATVSYALTGSRYFETLRLPVLRGRALTGGDGVPGRESVVVNERFAARFFPGDDPIGQRIRIADAKPGAAFPWLTIVGVSKAVPSPIAGSVSEPVVYLPFAADPSPDPSVTIVVRGAPVASATTALREVVWALDPTLPLYAIETLDTTVARGRYAQWLLGWWLGIVAAIAVVLSSVGLYALTAHGIAHRMQDIGLRMALGASPAHVAWVFFRRPLAQLAAGLALGMYGALNIGRFFQVFLGQTGPRDAATILTVVSSLILVSLIASLIPARRATRTDPVVALRYE
jgi:putative ABC transport system permease protein